MSEEKTAETLAKYNNAILIEQVALGILEQINTQDPATLARQLAEKTLGDQETIKQLETELAALREQSDRDPYNPEIYSAHGWHRIMKDKLSELKRHNSSAWLLVFDLDGFKQYNDTNGHVEGDKALGLAGQLARDALRQEDAVARLHGDEFLATIPGIKLEDVVLVGERIRKALSQLSTVLNTSIPLTASIGIAMIPEEVIQTRYDSDEQLKKALEQSYQLADETMFVAKKAGKNRVCLRIGNDEFKIFAGLTEEGKLTWQNPAPD